MRPLGILERLFLRIDGLTPFNVAAVASAAGALRPDAVRPALDLLQRRHPLLQVRIDADGAFAAGGVGALPLRRCERLGDEQWRDELEGELNRRFDHAAGPLARAVLLEGGEGCELILCASHVIADGRSTVRLLHDVLAAAAGAAVDGAPLPLRGPFEELAAQAAGLPASARAAARLQPGGEAAPWRAPRTRLVSFSLTAEQTGALLAAARREGTTVHAALCAALLLAIVAEAEADAAALTCTCPVDVRGLLQPPAPDDLGLYVSEVTLAQKVERGDAFWATGRALKQRLGSALARPERLLATDALRALAGVDEAGLRRGWSAASRTEVGVSNLGRVDAPPGPAPAWTAFAVTPPAGKLVVAAVTAAGRLHGSVTFPEPYVSAAWAEAVARGLRGRLLAACDGAGAPVDLPAALAALSASQRERLRDRLAALEARAEGDGAPFPLSYGQRSLLLLHALAPASTAYTFAVALKLGRAVDPARLRRAAQALRERHPLLRCRFEPGPAGPRQRPAAPDPAVGLTDAAGWDEAALRARLQAEAEAPFDLESGPVFRVHLFTRGGAAPVLLLTAHHIALDLTSLLVLLEELGGLLTADAPPGPPPAGYADFVAAEQRMLEGPDGQRLADYWRQALAGAPAALDLPADRPRRALPSLAGRAHRFHVPPASAAALAALARAEGVTPYVVLLAAFQLLLSRHCGQEELLVGSPASLRGRAELKGVVGDMVNTIVLRGDLSGDPSFRTLVRRAGRVVVEALAHREYPFPLLVERLNPPRDPGRPPLVQVLFQALPHAPELVALLSGEPGAARPGGLEVEVVPLEPRGAQFELGLELVGRGGGLVGTFTYASDLFAPETIARLAERFLLLLEAAGRTPDARAGALPLLPEQERALVVNGWNPEPAAPAAGGGVWARFATQAAASPSSPAVGWSGGAWSYAELERRARAVGRALQDAGVGPESRVAVLAPRGPELAAALLGTLAAGAAFVPLDPSHPEPRLREVLDDCGARVLLRAGPAPAPPLPRGMRALALEACLEAAGPGWEPVAPAPENLAYVLYTSGSTGRPKGVEVPHGALAGLLEAADAFVALAPSDVLLSVTTPAFDIFLVELLLPLVRGAGLVFASDEEVRDGAALAERLHACGATVLEATPSTWRLLLDSGWQGRPELRLISTGEALPPELARRLAACGRVLWNAYGPTETTIWSTAGPVDADAPVTLGRPLANTRTYVLDARLAPVPAGVVGELFLGGAGVGRGYCGRPELTAERFVPDPFGRPGARMYRTGDRARWLPDGRLDYCGRADRQLKLRGHRIEPAEIEARLEECAGVAEAAVVLREDEPGRPRLVGYVAAARAAERPTAAGLRRALAARLPAAFVPSAVVVMEGLPRTANGKLDRRALPAPEAAEAPAGAPAQPPRTELERAVAGVWQEVLRLPAVGRDDGFFDVGGHSLLLMEVRARLRERLGRDVPVRELLRHATVRALAAHLAGAAEPEAGGGADARAAQRLAAAERERQRRAAGRRAAREAP